MKRKIISGILALAMAFSLTSCRGQSKGAAEADASQAAESEAEGSGSSAIPTVEPELFYDYTPGVLNTAVGPDGKPVVTEFHLEGLQILSRADMEELAAAAEAP
nr:hypothetical protein [Lachnospiraceae bacterium]